MTVVSENEHAVLAGHPFTIKVRIGSPIEDEPTGAVIVSLQVPLCPPTIDAEHVLRFRLKS